MSVPASYRRDRLSHPARSPGRILVEDEWLDDPKLPASRGRYRRDGLADAMSPRVLAAALPIEGHKERFNKAKVPGTRCHGREGPIKVANGT